MCNLWPWRCFTSCWKYFNDLSALSKNWLEVILRAFHIICLVLCWGQGLISFKVGRRHFWKENCHFFTEQFWYPTGRIMKCDFTLGKPLYRYESSPPTLFWLWKYYCTHLRECQMPVRFVQIICKFSTINMPTTVSAVYLQKKIKWSV